MKEETKMENEYKSKLATMTNEELENETKEKIWSSTFWNRANDESHYQVDACYAEWIKRDGNDSTYKKLHQEVKKEYSR